MSINHDLLTPKVQVSVIIPTLNRGYLIGHTLRSLHAQTLKDWEVIVVDDGSVDRTADVVAEWMAQDDRIQYVKRVDHCDPNQPNGAPTCRNLGTQLAFGKYIVYVDSDDLLAQNALENRVRQMEQNPHLDFGIFPCIVFQNYPGDRRTLFNQDNGQDDLNRFLSLDAPWQTMGPIWRKTALQTLGLWDESLASLQDFDLHVRALVAGLSYQRFPEPDCFWRVCHQDTISVRSSHDPRAISKHAYLLEKIQILLRDTDLLVGDRLLRLIGLYLHFVDGLLRLNHPQAASILWQKCYDHNLISDSLYQDGRRYIQVIKWIPTRHLKALFRRLLRHYFQWSWSTPLLMPKWSKTVMQTPIPEDIPTPEVAYFPIAPLPSPTSIPHPCRSISI